MNVRSHGRAISGDTICNQPGACTNRGRLDGRALRSGVVGGARRAGINGRNRHRHHQVQGTAEVQIQSSQLSGGPEEPADRPQGRFRTRVQDIRNHPACVGPPMSDATIPRHWTLEIRCAIPNQTNDRETVDSPRLKSPGTAPWDSPRERPIAGDHRSSPLKHGDSGSVIRARPQRSISVPLRRHCLGPPAVVWGLEWGTGANGNRTNKLPGGRSCGGGLRDAAADKEKATRTSCGLESRHRDSNAGPTLYESVALPTELWRPETRARRLWIGWRWYRWVGRLARCPAADFASPSPGPWSAPHPTERSTPRRGGRFARWVRRQKLPGKCRPGCARRFPVMPTKKTPRAKQVGPGWDRSVVAGRSRRTIYFAAWIRRSSVLFVSCKTCLM